MISIELNSPLVQGSQRVIVNAWHIQFCATSVWNNTEMGLMVTNETSVIYSEETGAVESYSEHCLTFHK